MLVLTRRAGDSVVIDGRIEIKVLRIRGNQVHLGIEAPDDTRIHRLEVWARLQKDGSIATDPTDSDEETEPPAGGAFGPHVPVPA